MLNLQICTVIIMIKKKNIKKKINKKIKKKKKKHSCHSGEMNPRLMDSKSAYRSTTPWRPMRNTDKNNLYTVYAKNIIVSLVTSLTYVVS